MATLVRCRSVPRGRRSPDELSALHERGSRATGATTQSWVPALDVWETEDGSSRVRPARRRRGRSRSRSRTRCYRQRRARAGEQVLDVALPPLRAPLRHLQPDVGLPQGVDEAQIRPLHERRARAARAEAGAGQAPPPITMGAAEPATIEGDAAAGEAAHAQSTGPPTGSTCRRSPCRGSPPLARKRAGARGRARRRRPARASRRSRRAAAPRAVGSWPSDHSSRRSDPASRRANHVVAELLAQEVAQLRLERPRAQVRVT